MISGEWRHSTDSTLHCPALHCSTCTPWTRCVIWLSSRECKRLNVPQGHLSPPCPPRPLQGTWDLGTCLRSETKHVRRCAVLCLKLDRAGPLLGLLIVLPPWAVDPLEGVQRRAAHRSPRQPAVTLHGVTRQAAPPTEHRAQWGHPGSPHRHAA